MRQVKLYHYRKLPDPGIEVIHGEYTGENGAGTAQPRFMHSGAKPILSLFLLLAAVAGRAQVSTPSEYQLKAAFLFNFAKFIDWPPEAFPEKSSPVVIGVLGEDPFGEELKRTILNKSIADRSITNKPVGSIEEARRCHILFISTSEKKRLREIFDGLRGASVLTVGETDQFTETGGMINFVIKEKRIRFEIREDTARSAGLKISSKLLSLALPPAR